MRVAALTSWHEGLPSGLAHHSEGNLMAHAEWRRVEAKCSRRRAIGTDIAITTVTVEAESDLAVELLLDPLPHLVENLAWVTDQSTVSVERVNAELPVGRGPRKLIAICRSPSAPCNAFAACSIASLPRYAGAAHGGIPQDHHNRLFRRYRGRRRWESSSTRRPYVALSIVTSRKPQAVLELSRRQGGEVHW